jgi:hypothetical protein
LQLVTELAKSNQLRRARLDLLGAAPTRRTTERVRSHDSALSSTKKKQRSHKVLAIGMPLIHVHPHNDAAYRPRALFFRNALEVDLVVVAHAGWTAWWDWKVVLVHNFGVTISWGLGCLCVSIFCRLRLFLLWSVAVDEDTVSHRAYKASSRTGHIWEGFALDHQLVLIVN